MTKNKGINIWRLCFYLRRFSSSLHDFDSQLLGQSPNFSWHIWLVIPYARKTALSSGVFLDDVTTILCLAVTVAHSGEIRNEQCKPLQVKRLVRDISFADFCLSSKLTRSSFRFINNGTYNIYISLYLYTCICWNNYMLVNSYEAKSGKLRWAWFSFME